jgi:hypothetical protein
MLLHYVPRPLFECQTKSVGPVPFTRHSRRCQVLTLKQPVRFRQTCVCRVIVSFRSPSLFCLLTVGVEVVYFHLITLRHTPHSVGLLWTRDRPVAETSAWQHTHSQGKKIHDPGGIRTHDPSKRSAADLRLRPRGHWDRLQIYCPVVNYHKPTNGLYSHWIDKKNYPTCFEPTGFILRESHNH